MPQFAPSVAKTARAPIIVKPTGLECTAELYLGIILPGMEPLISKFATSGEIPFVSTGAAQTIALPINMPADEGIFLVYLDVYAEGMLIAAYKATQDVVITPPEPSALLIEYQKVLDEAYGHVEAGFPYDWIVVPGFGLQYCIDAIPQLKGLMVDEAISIGMISSSAEAYFDRAIMYFTDGTTIVPYWWPCPYCPEKLRSPALLEAHLQAEHYEIINTKGSITYFTGDLQCREYPYEDICSIIGIIVNWKNGSPFPIQGHIGLLRSGFYYHGYSGGSVSTPVTASSGQDVIVPPGGTRTVYFPVSSSPTQCVDCRATLTRIDGPLPGMVLGQETRTICAPEPAGI